MLLKSFWDKVTYFTDAPVAQCDITGLKNTILDDGNSGDHK